jgi:hypothetical protein
MTTTDVMLVVDWSCIENWCRHHSSLDRLQEIRRSLEEA